LVSNRKISLIRFSLLAALIGVLSISSFAGIGFIHSLLATSVGTNGFYDKVVILNFDDGRKSQFTQAKPILDKYGFKATFYVVCNYIGKKDGYMDWNEIKTLHKEGHDIGSHSMNHVRLEKLSKKSVQYEVGQSKRCLQDHGINAKSFAYPFDSGTDDKTIINIVAKYYDLARTASSPITFLRCDGWKEQSNQDDCRTYTDKDGLTYANRYTVRAWSQDATRIEDSASDDRMADKFIRIVDSQIKYNNAGTIKAIPIIIYHRVGESGERYNTDMKLFSAQMKYLHDNGYKVLTMADLGYDDKSNYLYLKVLKSETEQPIKNVTAPMIALATNATTNVTAPTIALATNATTNVTAPTIAPATNATNATTNVTAPTIAPATNATNATNATTNVTAPTIAPATNVTNATTNVTAPTIVPEGNLIIEALKKLFGLK
jgi:peptidoglycan/xylan/chitin deacetylase (PgdA/CDA1 family)